MNIKELIRFEDLKRKVIVEAIRILNMKGNLDERFENYRRFNNYIQGITEMFPDSTFVKKNRDYLLKMICDPFNIMNHFDCGDVDPFDVNNFVATSIKNEMEDIIKDYKENLLDFE